MYARSISVAAVCTFGLLALTGCEKTMTPEQKNQIFAQCVAEDNANKPRYVEDFCCAKRFSDPKDRSDCVAWSMEPHRPLKKGAGEDWLHLYGAK
jgi:hypothetical protein